MFISVAELEKMENHKNGIKKSQSTADNLSDGSNASNSNYSLSQNKSRSPFRKKELSPRLQEWEKIEDSVCDFDLFQFENVEDLAQSELNKYQGFSTFAQNIEKNEKKNFFSSKKKNNLSDMRDSFKQKNINKAINFNEMYPPRLCIRSQSEVKSAKEQPLKIKRHFSEMNLPIHQTLSFLDMMLKSGKINYKQESAFKVLKMKIFSISQKLSESKIEVQKFGPWGEIWQEKEQQIRQNSPYGHFLSYKLRPIMVKGGDDLRQEIIAMQIIKKLQKIFKEAKIMAYLRPYEVIVTSANSGIIGFFC